MLHEMDKEALMHITDIQVRIHKEGNGFDLIFFFGHNGYFQDGIAMKKYIIPRPEILEEIVGHTFLWQIGDYTPVKYEPKASILSDGMLSELEARRSGVGMAGMTPQPVKIELKGDRMQGGGDGIKSTTYAGEPRFGSEVLIEKPPIATFKNVVSLTRAATLNATNEMTLIDNSAKLILPEQRSEKALVNYNINRSNLNVDKGLTYRLFGHMPLESARSKDLKSTTEGFFKKKISLFGKSNKVSTSNVNEESVQIQLQKLI